MHYYINILILILVILDFRFRFLKNRSLLISLSVVHVPMVQGTFGTYNFVVLIVLGLLQQ